VFGGWRDTLTHDSIEPRAGKSQGFRGGVETEGVPKVGTREMRVRVSGGFAFGVVT
jgi:hypothetical protein